MRLHPQQRFDSYVAQGWWSLDTWDDLFAARVAERGDATALVDPPNRALITDGVPGRWTWRQVDEYVDRLAAVLLAHGGPTRRRRRHQLPNVKELAACYLALARIGAIASPFPIQYRSHELGQLGRLAEVSAFITTTRIGERRPAEVILALSDELPTLETVFAWGDPPAGAVRLDAELVAADVSLVAAHLESFVAHANDCVTICWTSGTESVPEGGALEPTRTGWRTAWAASTSRSSPRRTSCSIPCRWSTRAASRACSCRG